LKKSQEQPPDEDSLERISRELAELRRLTRRSLENQAEISRRLNELLESLGSKSFG
jgi:hypothetical protein